MYGRKFMGVERSTFLIDPKGKVAKVWRKVKVNGHADAVLEAVDAGIDDDMRCVAVIAHPFVHRSDQVGSF